MNGDIKKHIRCLFQGTQALMPSITLKRDIIIPVLLPYEFILCFCCLNISASAIYSLLHACSLQNWYLFSTIIDGEMMANIPTILVYFQLYKTFRWFHYQQLVTQMNPCFQWVHLSSSYLLEDWCTTLFLSPFSFVNSQALVFFVPR